jgi:hypothetical protein
MRTEPFKAASHVAKKLTHRLAKLTEQATAKNRQRLFSSKVVQNTLSDRMRCLLP